MHASLAVVQAAGALTLDMEVDSEPAMMDDGTAPSVEPVSPWAGSTYTCGSPWSPMTPAVVSRATSGSLNAFGMSPNPQSPGLVRRDSGVGVVHAQPVASRIVSGPMPVAQASPVRVGPVRTTRVTFAPSPTSPGAEIRRNAANFGIPLNLRAGDEVSAPVPVPVRTVQGAIVAPSPMSRQQLQAGGAVPSSSSSSLPAQPVVAFGAFTTAAGAPQLQFQPQMVPVAAAGTCQQQPQMQQQPPAFLRSIVTPLTHASRPRKAAGGA